MSKPKLDPGEYCIFINNKPDKLLHRYFAENGFRWNSGYEDEDKFLLRGEYDYILVNVISERLWNTTRTRNLVNAITPQEFYKVIGLAEMEVEFV